VAPKGDFLASLTIAARAVRGDSRYSAWLRRIRREGVPKSARAKRHPQITVRSPRQRPRVSVGHRSAHDIARCAARRADIKSVEVILVPEMDAIINPLGIKGVGEVANVGTSAAIANAVYHATGKRIRKLSIRIETLLD